MIEGISSASGSNFSQPPKMPDYWKPFFWSGMDKSQLEAVATHDTTISSTHAAFVEVAQFALNVVTYLDKCVTTGHDLTSPKFHDALQTLGSFIDQPDQDDNPNLFGSVARGYQLNNIGHISEPSCANPSLQKPIVTSHSLYTTLERIEGIKVSYDSKGKASFSYPPEDPTTQWSGMTPPPTSAQLNQMKTDLGSMQNDLNYLTKNA